MRRALAVVLFSWGAACAPPETNARIEVQPGAAGRICSACIGPARADAEMCPPELLASCQELTSDVRGPPARLIEEDGGLTPLGADE